MNTFWSFFEILNKGGWVAWCLAILSLMLWYALGYRYLCLKTKVSFKKSLFNVEEFDDTQDFVLHSLKKVKNISNSSLVDKSLAIECVRQSLEEHLKVFKSAIRSIVLVAPLLGLLGTVIGMIETFDSLQSASLFTQGGGIAGGISQALITTQMGLVVAIPGLLIGRKLDRKHENIIACFDQYAGQAIITGGRS